MWMNRVHNKTVITFTGEREISLANFRDEEFANSTQVYGTRMASIVNYFGAGQAMLPKPIFQISCHRIRSFENIRFLGIAHSDSVSAI